MDYIEEDLRWFTVYKKTTAQISLTHEPTDTTVQGSESTGRSLYLLKEELRNRLKEKLDNEKERKENEIKN